MNTGLDEFEYGFFSNHWMLKAALCYVPRMQLNIAISAVIDRLVAEGEEVSGGELLQMLAQIALTGQYYVVGSGVEGAVPERDVEQFARDLQEMPDAVDPMVDFKLNNKNEEENNDG